MRYRCGRMALSIDRLEPLVLELRHQNSGMRMIDYCASFEYAYYFTRHI